MSTGQQYTEQFHRSLLLRLFPVAILLAVAAALLFPPGLNVLGGALILLGGGTVLLLPYWSDSVTFSDDGTVLVGRRALRGENCSGCRYRRIVVAGRSIRFGGFALYDETRTDGLPAVFIPVHGWMKTDQIKLYRALLNWLEHKDVALTPDDRERLGDIAGRSTRFEGTRPDS